jgi:hypothetical protein
MSDHTRIICFTTEELQRFNKLRTILENRSGTRHTVTQTFMIAVDQCLDKQTLTSLRDKANNTKVVIHKSKLNMDVG